MHSRWAVLSALAFMMSVSMGLPIYGGSVLSTFMAAELDWERKTLGLLIAAIMLANGLSAPLVAALIARMGVRWCLITGFIFLAAASMALAIWVTAPWQAVLAYAAIGIAASFAGVVPCQTGVAAWFGHRRPFALSVLWAAMGIGGFVFVWLLTWAIQASAYGFRMGCWVFFGFSAAGLVVALFVREKPPMEQFAAWENTDVQAQSGRPSSPHPGPTGSDLPLRHALGAPALWTIYFGMFASTCASSFVIAHAQAHLRDLGHSPVAAAATISIFSAMIVAGNLGVGWIAQRIGPRRAYFGALGVLAAGLLLLSHAGGVLGLYGYAIVFGLGFGATQVGPMVLLSGYWGVRLFPMLTAIGLLIQTAGGAIAPVVAGAYFDSHGGYQPVIFTIAVTNLLAIALLRVIGPPRPQSA